MKAVIRGVVWLNVDEIDPVHMHFLRNDCTIIPKATSTYAEPSPIRVYGFSPDRKMVWIPRGYYLKTWRNKTGLIYDEDVRVSEGFSLRETRVLFTPRPDDQKPVIDAVCEKMLSRSWFAGSIEAYTSWGKSLSAAEIIRRLGRNALVIVHTTPLLDQWKLRVKQYCPDWKVGTIGGGVCEYEGKDIVVATVQSLMSNPEKLPKGLWDHFGVLCVDELHRYGAEKFSSVIPRFNVKYAFGMSGTLRRLDKTENVFRYIIGDVIARATEENRIVPQIFTKDTKVEFPSHLRGAQKSQFLGYIESHKARTEMIAKDVVAAVRKGRYPLVLSERLTLLRELSLIVERMLKEESLDKTQGFFIGGKTKEERSLASNCDIIYATTQLAKEGIDIPRLDTLLMITPCSDPEQAIGRVVRKHPNKKQPMVVDYVDLSIPNFRYLFTSRMRLYRKNRWEVLGFVQKGREKCDG